MKKVIRCLGMVALMALAFTSCKKTEQQSTFTATMPQLIVQDEDRAYIDAQNKVHFEIGDRVMIFNICLDSTYRSHCATYKAVQEGNTVQFVNSGMGTVGTALNGGYYCYYPSTLVADPEDEWNFTPDRVITELEYGQNKAKFFISPDQQYREGLVARKDLYLAGHLTQQQAPTLAAANFQMKFLCGVLQLKPFESARRTVTKIEVVDNHFTTTGWVEVTIPECNPEDMMDMFNRYDESNPAYVHELQQFIARTGYHVEGPGKGNVVTLHMPTGGVRLGNSKATTPAFNIVQRPLANMEGCHIIFTFSDGKHKDVDLSAYGYLLKMKPNYLFTLGLNLDAFPETE
jgi:hypothetical protein